MVVIEVAALLLVAVAAIVLWRLFASPLRKDLLRTGQAATAQERVRGAAEELTDPAVRSQLEQLRRRADSIEGRLTDELGNLRVETRAYEAVRGQTQTELLSDVQQLQAAVRVLSSQFARLEDDVARSLAAQAEARRDALLRDEAERAQRTARVLGAIDELLDARQEAPAQGEQVRRA